MMSSKSDSYLSDGAGKRKVYLYNTNMDPKYYYFDINPVSIQFDRIADVDRQLVKGGYHYQFKRVRRESGVIVIDTGVRGLRYLKDLANWIELWMKANVNNRVGPITLSDVAETDPLSGDALKLDIIFNQLPLLGRDKSRGDIRYMWRLPFMITQDYVDKLDISQLTSGQNIDTLRGSNILVKADGKMTLAQLAKRYYGGGGDGVTWKQGVNFIKLANPDSLPGHPTEGTVPAKDTYLIIPYVSEEVFTRYQSGGAGSQFSEVVSSTQDIIGGLFEDITGFFS